MFWWDDPISFRPGGTLLRDAQYHEASLRSSRCGSQRAGLCLGHHSRRARFNLDLIRSGCAYSVSMKPPPACPQHEAEYEQSICSSQRPCDSLKWLAFGCDAEPGGNKSCRDH